MRPYSMNRAVHSETIIPFAECPSRSKTIGPIHYPGIPNNAYNSCPLSPPLVRYGDCHQACSGVWSLFCVLACQGHLRAAWINLSVCLILDWLSQCLLTSPNDYIILEAVMVQWQSLVVSATIRFSLGRVSYFHLLTLVIK